MYAIASYMQESPKQSKELINIVHSIEGVVFGGDCRTAKELSEAEARGLVALCLISHWIFVTAGKDSTNPYMAPAVLAGTFLTGAIPLEADVDESNARP
jgi:hypothetical protein